MIEASRWDELVVPKTKQDFQVIQVVSIGLPDDWMSRTPHALVCGGAMLAVRYERKAVSESMRNHVMFSDPGPEITEAMKNVPDLARIAGLYDRYLFDMANFVERGMYH